jgi:hypothetical protein
VSGVLRIHPADVMVLGDEHPLVHAERALGQAVRQAAACAAALAATPALLPLGAGLAASVTLAAVLVELVLLARVGLVWCARRARVHDLIVGGAGGALPLVRREAARLLEPAHREAVAATLERALRDAERWHTFLPASRPVGGIRGLAPHGEAVRELAAALRSGAVTADVVVLTEWLLNGGYGAGLDPSRGDGVARELGRIRFRLAAAAAQPRSR